MYLFARQAHVRGANAMAWATRIRDHAAKVSESDIQLWATMLSPGFGTMTWTSSWSNLATLQSSFAKLVGDATYASLAEEGQEFVTDGLDDGLFETIYDGSGESGDVRIVGSIRAVCANGQVAKAMVNGIEIAQRAESVTGRPTMFVGAITGNYGEVGWLTGYEDLAAFQDANSKLNANAEWIAFIDGATSCYAQDVSATQSSLHMLVP